MSEKHLSQVQKRINKLNRLSNLLQGINLDTEKGEMNEREFLGAQRGLKICLKKIENAKLLAGSSLSYKEIEGIKESISKGKELLSRSKKNLSLSQKYEEKINELAAKLNNDLSGLRGFHED